MGVSASREGVNLLGAITEYGETTVLECGGSFTGEVTIRFLEHLQAEFAHSSDTVLFTPIEHAHNARMDATLYGQRWIAETAFSTTKRSHGGTERAREWHREFREVVLLFAIHNIESVCKSL